MPSEPHPDIQAVLTELDKQGIPEMNTLSVDGARSLLEELFASTDDPEPVGAVRNFSIDGPGGGVPIRIYTPEGSGPFPVLVYFHGGGWILGSLDTHDPTCRALTNASDCAVVSVDYRRPPEHPFPAPVKDCYAATRWVSENPGVVHGDPDRIAVGGDSAGGNLAAAVAQIARDSDGPSLAHQTLLYPATNHAFDTASYSENAEGYFLTKADMEWFWDHYLPYDLNGQNPYASPLRARDLTGLPTASVVTCGFDPLRDEGLAYARRLNEAGVNVTSRTYEDMIHGFMSMLVEPDLDHARDAIAEIGADLQTAFATES